MGLYRSPEGVVTEIDDNAASAAVAGGYEPISSGQAGAPRESLATGGALGSLSAGATSLASGASLGLSDLTLKAFLNRGHVAQLAADRQANPVITGVGQFAGALLPTLAAPETLLAKAPSAVLARGVAPLIERGGVASLLGSGLEGSAYGAGAYLSDVALGDRKLSAEGVAGAVGGGFAFGLGGGAAVMGIEKGSIAARRLFSRLADGGERASTDAEQAWQAAHQTTLETYDAAADIAKAQLAKARATRESAGLARDQASAAHAEISALRPEIDAAHAAATGLDAKIAAIEAADAPLAGMKVGTLEDLDRLVADHFEAKSELDELLQRIEAPDLGGMAPPSLVVPVGEFGPVGARGAQSLEDMARRALGEATPAVDATGVAAPKAIRELASGTPAGARVEPSIPTHDVIKAHEVKADDYLERTVPARDIADRGYYEPAGGHADPVRTANAQRAIADGQREPIKLNVAPDGKITVTDGRHRLAAAIEDDAPVRVNWSTGAAPATDDVLRGGTASTPQAKRLDRHQAAAASADLQSQLDPKLQHAIADYEGSAAKKNLSRRSCANGVCDTVEPEFREIAGGLERHRINLVTDDGIAEAKRLYHMTDEQVASMTRLNNGRMKRLGVPPDDMFHQISVTPDGIAIDWTANQFNKLPVPYVFRLRPAAEPVGDLVALLRGTKDRLTASETLAAIGAPARAEYAATKAAQTAESAAGARAAARAENYAGSDMAVAERAAQAEARAQRAGVLGRGQGYRPRAFAERPVAPPALESAQQAIQRGATAGTNRRAIRQLEVAQDGALERAAVAADPAERTAALAEAHAAERQLAGMGVMPAAHDDIARLAPAITKYERKSAALVEGLGDLAPPLAREHAAAFRAAEDAADRKMMDRATRAVDDAADLPQVGKDRRPTANQPAGPHLAARKQALRTADAAYKRARAVETEAKIGARTAAEQAKAARTAAGAAPSAVAASAGKSSMFGTVATAIGLAGELGIPGVPKPHDIPVIGPLLSAYIKYRALKATAGRFVGRVVATGDARAAALVARTKDKIVTAVDRSLGLVATAASTARPGIVAASAVIGKRLFDDGRPDAGKGATKQEQAAARVREIITAASRPDLVTAMVRREMHEVADPDLIAAAEQHLIARFSHLADVVPKPPPDNAYAQRPWTPSPSATHELEQRLAVIHDPAGTLADILDPKATHPGAAAADTFRKVHIELLGLAKQRLITRLGDMDEPMPRDARLRAGAFFQLPLDISLDPSHIAIVRAPEPPQPQPPMPTGTGSFNLSKMYDPLNTRSK